MPLRTTCSPRSRLGPFGFRNGRLQVVEPPVSLGRSRRHTQVLPSTTFRSSYLNIHGAADDGRRCCLGFLTSSPGAPPGITSSKVCTKRSFQVYTGCTEKQRPGLGTRNSLEPGGPSLDVWNAAGIEFYPMIWGDGSLAYSQVPTLQASNPRVTSETWGRQRQSPCTVGRNRRARHRRLFQRAPQSGDGKHIK